MSEGERQITHALQYALNEDSGERSVEETPSTDATVNLHWELAYRAEPRARVIADRHYNRQSIGSSQFVPPGRCLVLSMSDALWITSWPYPEYVKHGWPGAWVCSAFRNEGDVLSSTLITEAAGMTRWYWPEAIPPLGMITFVNPDKVRHKRDPGRCFLKAGFQRVGRTKGGLVALQLLPADMPNAIRPLRTQEVMF